MMTLEQFLLMKVAEEAVEVSQRALKAMQFGLDEVQKGQKLTNAERLNGELNDLLAILFLMTEKDIFKFEENDEAIEAKMDKVAKYLAYSRELKCVE